MLGGSDVYIVYLVEFG